MKPIAIPRVPAIPPGVRPSQPPVPGNAVQPRANVFRSVEPLSSLRRPEGATVSLAG